MKPSTQKKKITVAYADDHVAVRKAITSYLHDLGDIEVVIEADNGKELIEKIETSNVVPDVCIIDLKMPVLNGFETVPILRQKWKDIKILVLSTFVEEPYVVKMIRAGVNGYLSKSCDPEEIKAALLAIHNEGRYYSELFMENVALAIQQEQEKPTRISEKERVFLIHSCSDMSYAEIALKMKCTVKSVEGYRDNLFRKLGVNSRVSLVLYAIKSGLVPIENNPM
jgi:two-component system invasion response regulator UvrY